MGKSKRAFGLAIGVCCRRLGRQEPHVAHIASYDMFQDVPRRPLHVHHLLSNVHPVINHVFALTCPTSHPPASPSLSLKTLCPYRWRPYQTLDRVVVSLVPPRRLRKKGTNSRSRTCELGTMTKPYSMDESTHRKSQPSSLSP